MVVASIPIKEQLLLVIYLNTKYDNSGFNSYKGTIVILTEYLEVNLEFSFNSYKGTIVIVESEDQVEQTRKASIPIKEQLLYYRKKIKFRLYLLQFL